MLNVQDQLFVRPDHISGVGQIVHPASLKNDVRIFDIYLLGGQTITIRVPASTADAARAEVIKAVDDLP